MLAAVPAPGLYAAGAGGGMAVMSVTSPIIEAAPVGVVAAAANLGLNEALLEAASPVSSADKSAVPSVLVTDAKLCSSLPFLSQPINFPVLPSLDFWGSMGALHGAVRSCLHSV